MLGRGAGPVGHEQVDLGLAQRRIVARQRDMGGDHLVAFLRELQRGAGLNRRAALVEDRLGQ